MYETTITAPGAHRNLINSKYYCLAEKSPGSLLSLLFFCISRVKVNSKILSYRIPKKYVRTGKIGQRPSPHLPGFSSNQKQPCPRVWFWFRTKDSSQLALCPLNGDILYVCGV